MSWMIRSGRANSTHINGTLVPVEEPSTASIPDGRGTAAERYIRISDTPWNYLGVDGMTEEWWSTMSHCSPRLTYVKL
jgi:hypothetical protein